MDIEKLINEKICSLMEEEDRMLIINRVNSIDDLSIDIDDNSHFTICLKIVNHLMQQNEFCLNNSLVENFYMGIVYALTEMISLEKLHNNSNVWAETRISSLLFEMMDDDKILSLLLLRPEEFVLKLEKVSYKGSNLKDVFNEKMLLLRNSRISSIDMLVSNEIAMDLVEVISDCGNLLSMDTNKVKKIGSK